MSADSEISELRRRLDRLENILLAHEQSFRLADQIVPLLNRAARGRPIPAVRREARADVPAMYA